MPVHRHHSESSTRPYRAVHERGRRLLLDPLTNKGTAFTSEERVALGLQGLLAPAVCTLDQQLTRAYENFLASRDPIRRYIYLAALQDRNEVLFFRLLHEHIDEMMPIVYTPTVGEACQRFSHIYRRARGLYVGWDNRGRIADVLRNYHAASPSLIVVTDGERILGLGDQGAGGMGIPIGKLCLYTLCAGIPPETTLPVTLDVGTDNEDLLVDPLYLGLRQKRVRGEAYQEFIDEFVEAVREIFPRAILQWEDFLKENAMKQLERFRDRITSFNDDIEGTASVTLAGILAAQRITGKKLSEQTFLLAGAGASAQGIAALLVTALVEEGLSEEEARHRIIMFDSRGLVAKNRRGLEDFKLRFARREEEIAGWECQNPASITLLECVENARPNVLIGTSAQAGLFTEPVVRAMARSKPRPVIFPLSNPTSKAECTPENAIAWSGGRALVATGSPFPPVTFDGKTFRIGQCNNSFVFPGIGLGAWVGRVSRITRGMFLDAARALESAVSDADLDESALYPSLSHAREISHAVACAVVRRAIHEGLAEPALEEGLEKRVEDAMWFPDYLPYRYEAAPELIASH